MGTIVTIVITALIVIFCLINIRKMIWNVRHGRSIDGCNGDCSHCRGCSSERKKQK